MTSSASENMIPIDYTSRDYTSLRQDLINVIQSRIPEWQADDPADFGVALVEAFAYMGDILNYYIDRSAAETFLGTASLRQSLLNIAGLLGYSPAGKIAATVPVTFTNTGTTDTTILSGAQISTVLTNQSNLALTFEVTANPDTANGSWPVSSGGHSTVIPCVEGKTSSNVLLGQSTGAPGQSYAIRDASLINRSLSISVGASVANATPYTYVQNLYEATPTDTMFTYRTDDQDITTVSFGDGVSGAIPPIYQNIYATYRLGGGTVGNIAHGQSFTPVGFTFTGTITNQIAATGGAEAESNDHIRQAAFTAFRTRNSAVTKQDFQDLALTDNRVAKAKSRGNSPSNMIVYIAPLSSGDQKTDPQPGYDAYNVIARQVTSNVATLTLSEMPQFTSESVTISGMGAPWDGTVTATASTTGDTTVTYPLTTADVNQETCTGILSTGELADFAATRADVAASIQTKGVVGTIVNVLPPRYKDIKLGVEIGILPQYRQSQATTSVQTALATLFNYNQIPFNIAVRPQDILAFLVNNVPELMYATVTLYNAPDATTSVPLVTAASDEIVRLLSGNLTITIDAANPGIVNA